MTISGLPSLLHIPNFRFLWLGLLFISSGVQFYSIALTWLVLGLTGSSAQLGAILAVAAVPRAIMMLFSGAIIDRSPPRRLLLITSLGSGVVTALIALTLHFELLTVVGLGVAGVVLGLMDAFFYPTINAVVARTVERSQLARANALTQGGDGIINMLAPAGSGLIVGAVGLEWAFVLNAVLFGLGFVMIW